MKHKRSNPFTASWHRDYGKLEDGDSLYDDYYDWGEKPTGFEPWHDKDDIEQWDIWGSDEDEDEDEDEDDED